MTASVTFLSSVSDGLAVFPADSFLPPQLSFFVGKQFFPTPSTEFFSSDGCSSAVQSDQMSSWSDIDCPFNSKSFTASPIIFELSLSMSFFPIVSSVCFPPSFVADVDSSESS